MTGSQDLYDAVIVGGGPAGSSAAIHLAMRGARVFLAEQKKFPRQKLCGEFISPECLEHFVRLGVADEIESADGASLSETIFYARNGTSVNIPSNWFGRANATALGLSRAEMDARLLTRARDVGVEVHEEVCATDLLLVGDRVDGVQFKTVNNETFSARALITIDATGRTRLLARRVEKRTGKSNDIKKRPRLVAFKAHLAGAVGSVGTCEIYVYRGGYGGLNSIENGLSNLCFIASARDVRACGGDAQRVVRQVVLTNQRAAVTLAHAQNVSPWIAVALDGFGKQRLDPADGLITVGDAASFIDPFTGSGMLMALESGELAAAAVTRHLTELRQRRSLKNVAEDYREIYRKRFAARLHVSAGLRRAAFIPKFAEGMIIAVRASDILRRKLARATRYSRVDAGSTAS